MQPTKIRSRTEGPCSTALICAGAIILLLVLYARGSTLTASDKQADAPQSLGTSSAGDGKLGDARRLVGIAEVLRAQWNEASLRQAIGTYDKAVAMFIANNALSEAAEATLKSGDVCFVLSDLQEALKRYGKAVALARSANNSIVKARALSQMALVYSYIGNNDLAQSQVTKALQLFDHPESDPNPVIRNTYAEALSTQGEISYAKGDLVKSRKQFELARSLFVDNREGEARVHLFEGYIAGSLGEPDKALSETNQALELYRAINNKSGEGLALTLMGLSHSRLREEDAAIGLHRQAIEIFSAIGDRHSLGIALNGLGQSFENLHEYQTALSNYEQALRIFQDRRALDLAASATYKIAKVHRLMDDLDQALVYYEQCVALSRSAGKVRTEANALVEIAIVYDRLGHPEKALQQHQRIQRFYESIGDRRGLAIALNANGDFLVRLGKKQQALAAYKRALVLAEMVRDNGILLSTLYNVARAHYSLGSYEVALSFIERSLELIEQLRTNVGSPELRASYLSGVRKHYELCIDILTTLDRLRPGEGFAARALSVSEDARARSLLDLIIESQADLRQGVSPELLERERELSALLRTQAQYEMELSLTSKDPAEVAEVNEQIGVLRVEYQQLQSQLRVQKPLLSPTRFGSSDLERIQTELRETDSVLLEFQLGDEQSHLLFLTANSIRSYNLPPRKTLDDAAAELSKLITARQAFGPENAGDYQAKVVEADSLYFQKSAAMSRMLLGPVADELGTKRLLIVSEGALQYLSFEALPAPDGPAAGPLDAKWFSDHLLLARHEIDYESSISTLIAIQEQKSRPRSANKVIAVIADPVFNRSDNRVQAGGLTSTVASAAPNQNSPNPVPGALNTLLRSSGPARLIHASEEADSIAEAAPPGTTMVAKGFDASRETAMSSEVGQYQILHFATHGFLDSEHPELSAIVLTMVDQNGVAKNGLMPLHDIYNLSLSADLTVLSACQTALGKDVKGEGLVGLSHGFLSAGSKSVVASLWKVDDRTTAMLMADFYRSMLKQGMTPAAALRRAKLNMMRQRQWTAPYYWAGFVFQGDYRNHIAIESGLSTRRDLMLLVLAILISSSVLVIYLRRRRSSTPGADSNESRG
jgi:CHAT domain-containing protein/tetratricopeptide (TPR) repeat protein